MNIEGFRNYCLNKKGVTEELPFDKTTLVYKVMGKIFALTDTEDEFSINLKCKPEKAIELREQFSGSVLPGYHMHKKHWNTILMHGKIPGHLICQWIDESYQLVVDKLTKAQKQALENL
ncbi:MAG TPA: MmcQ/YjbR family DNA-binding protein [Bacteroidales bacterium]|nr:MmcQ/YjbR family DNA-binding protein [Bacteroidales bacterium]